MVIGSDTRQSLIRMVQLVIVRHAPARVSRDKATGGWVHRYRGGSLVSPTPRGRPMPLVRRDTEDIFFHSYQPKPGDVVVEIGAEYGTETVVLSAAVGSTGRVVAIEAHPWTCSLLARTVELSGCSNVTVVNAAVVGTPGVVKIENFVDANTVSNSVVTGRGTVEVEGLTLDEVLERFGIDHVDLLKVNIEGAERELAKGATRSMARVRHAVISCHDFEADAGHGEVFRTGDAIDRWLADLGWNVTRRPDDPRPWVRHYRYATNPSAV